MARVRLDASHVSRFVTARREKTTRYIRVLNQLSEVRTFSLYSLRLRVRADCERGFVVRGFYWSRYWCLLCQRHQDRCSDTI